MKLIQIMFLLLTVVTANASWFSDKEQQQQLEQTQQQLTQAQASKDDWQVIAGVLGIGTVVLFVVGTALGSTIRRYGQPE